MSAIPASAMHTGLDVSPVENTFLHNHMPAAVLLYSAVLFVIVNSAGVVCVDSEQQGISQAHGSQCH